MSQERYPIKQMYDELGNPFYPITHVDLVIGDKDKLADLGTTTSKVDLSEFILNPYNGTFTLYILNNFIYFYTGSIMYADGNPIPVDEEIVIAKDIPTSYRSSLQIIHCKAIGSTKERINIWINEKGELVIKITPRALYKDEDYSDYKSSISSIDFDGQFVKTSVEE